MFCTECGTKLEDNASFCTNCGYKIPTEYTMGAAEGAAVAAAAVATPVAEPVSAPGQEVSQSAYSQPAGQSMYTESFNQPMYSQSAGQSMYTEGTSQAMYSQPTDTANQSMYSQSYGQSADAATAGIAYGASQANYGGQGAYNAQNTYGGQNMYNGQNTYASQPMNASYAYNANQQPDKKKGKGCLIVAFIIGGLLLLGIIIVLVIIIAGSVLLSDSGSGYEYEYDYGTDYEYNYSYSYDYEVPEELGDLMDETDDFNYETSYDSYDLDDVYGYWEGTSKLISVSGADEMQEYLEELIGRPLTEEEIAGLYGESATESGFWLDVFEYEGWEGFWNLELNMGDYFGYEGLDVYDAMTYEDYTDGYYYDACIDLDSNNCFELEIMERDPYGEYGCQFFDAYDYDVVEEEVANDGAYGFKIVGQMVDEDEIRGQIVILFQYGDMSEPYGMAYEYVLTDKYEY